MGLDKSTLNSDIKSTLKDLFSMKENTEGAIDKFASDLSDAIDKYVKSGKVEVDVNTSGSPTSHTGKGIGKIS